MLPAFLTGIINETSLTAKEQWKIQATDYSIEIAGGH